MSNVKLLVNNPQGEQQILDIHVSGSYFEKERILWDEREDGPMPQKALGNLGGLSRSMVGGKPSLKVSQVKVKAAKDKRAADKAEHDAKKLASEERESRLKAFVGMEIQDADLSDCLGDVIDLLNEKGLI